MTATDSLHCHPSPDFISASSLHTGGTFSKAQQTLLSLLEFCTTHIATKKAQSTSKAPSRPRASRDVSLIQTISASASTSQQSTANRAYAVQLSAFLIEKLATLAAAVNNDLYKGALLVAWSTAKEVSQQMRSVSEIAYDAPSSFSVTLSSTPQQAIPTAAVLVETILPILRQQSKKAIHPVAVESSAQVLCCLCIT